MKTYSKLFIIFILFTSCKKYKQNTCLYEVCDDRRFTKITADNTNGIMIYNNEINKWGIISYGIGNSGIKRTSYICGPLNDSFKLEDKKVIYSGNLKESCDIPRPTSSGEAIYYIKPTMIK